jgi:hypothetical protein
VFHTVDPSAAVTPAYLSAGLDTLHILTRPP